MIKVTVFYPNSEGSHFDIDYYVDVHMPLVAKHLGSALVKYEVDHGLAGGTPGAPAPFAGAGHLYFDTLEDFQTSFPPHQPTFMADIPNYTNIAPLVQISEVR